MKTPIEQPEMEKLADNICKEELGQEPNGNNLAFRKILVHGMVRWNALMQQKPNHIDDAVGAFEETLIAEMGHAIEQQEQCNREEFHAGREDALSYSLYMLRKHLTDNKETYP